MKTIKILVCHHKPGPWFENEVFLPIQVGRAISSVDLPMIGDNTGQNISEKNGSWCEITALYWARYNIDADYIGLAHYRRMPNFGNPDDLHSHYFFDASPSIQERFGWTEEKVRTVVENSDIVTLPYWLVTPVGSPKVMTNIAQYAYSHFRRDIELVLEIIRIDHPEFYPHALKIFYSHRCFFANLIVMKREHFHSYADWLFDILNKAEAAIDTSEYDVYQKRVIGFLAERLVNVYVSYLVEERGARHKEVGLAYGIFNAPPSSAVIAQNPQPPDERTQSDDRIHVVFAIDGRFAPHCAAAMQSMLSNMHPAQAITAHIVNDGSLSAEVKDLLAKTTAPWANAEVRFHELDAKRFSHLPMNRSHVSVATYFRLVLHHIIDARRVIYLDSDILVIDNIAELWTTDLGGQPVAGCPDEGGVNQTRRLRLSESHTYFNGGVLILDLNKLKASPPDIAYLESYLKNQDYITLQDQDILNITFMDRTKRLHLRWNTHSRLFGSNELDYRYSEQEAQAARDQPGIIHFSDERKPWKIGCRNPYAGLYWEYRNQTPFAQTRKERAVYKFSESLLPYPRLTSFLLKVRNRLRRLRAA